MQNSIVLKNGRTVWLTQDETDYVVHLLLNGSQFINIPRIQQTYNATEIAYCGINQIFFIDKIKGGDFRFSSSKIVCMKDGIEYYIDSKSGWEQCKGEFEKAETFEDFIEKQRVPSKPKKSVEDMLNEEDKDKVTGRAAKVEEVTK